MATGTLQSSWGVLLSNFSSVILAYTNMSGNLPPKWASGLRQVRHLQLDGNYAINGPIPLAWQRPGVFPAMQDFSVQNTLVAGGFPGAMQSQIYECMP